MYYTNSKKKCYNQLQLLKYFSRHFSFLFVFLVCCFYQFLLFFFDKERKQCTTVTMWFGMIVYIATGAVTISGDTKAEKTKKEVGPVKIPAN